MKYCVVDKETNQKISRFFRTEKQARMRKSASSHIIMTKAEAVEQGIFVKDKHKSLVIIKPMSEVKGLFIDDKSKQSLANRKNRDVYIDYCRRHGFYTFLS